MASFTVFLWIDQRTEKYYDLLKLICSLEGCSS